MTEEEAWDQLRREEALAWDVYFASVTSIQYHPANPPKTRLSLEALGEIADRMLEIRRKRCPLRPLSLEA